VLEDQRTLRLKDLSKSFTGRDLRREITRRGWSAGRFLQHDRVINYRHPFWPKSAKQFTPARRLILLRHDVISSPVSSKDTLIRLECVPRQSRDGLLMLWVLTRSLRWKALPLDCKKLLLRTISPRTPWAYLIINVSNMATGSLCTPTQLPKPRTIPYEPIGRGRRA